MGLRLRTSITNRRWSISCSRGLIGAACLIAIALAGCRPEYTSQGFAVDRTGSIERKQHRSDLQIAQASFQRGAYGLAEKHYRRAIEDNRRNAEAWLGLAASYDHLKRFDLADRAYDELRALTGDNAVVFNNLGYSHTLRGDFAKAAKLLARAQRLAPDDERVLENIDFLNRRRAAARG